MLQVCQEVHLRRNSAASQAGARLWAPVRGSAHVHISRCQAGYLNRGCKQVQCCLICSFPVTPATCNLLLWSVPVFDPAHLLLFLPSARIWPVFDLNPACSFNCHAARLLPTWPVTDLTQALASGPVSPACVWPSLPVLHIPQGRSVVCQSLHSGVRCPDISWSSFQPARCPDLSSCWYSPLWH